MKLICILAIYIDIECAGRKGVFPEAEKDPVIQIANLVTVQGTSFSILFASPISFCC